ncbi:MAG: hypothetical protein HC932_02245 [Thermales bacterium]|nr:hypothetical protein [Thermales bacterium]
MLKKVSFKGVQAVNHFANTAEKDIEKAFNQYREYLSAQQQGDTQAMQKAEATIKKGSKGQQDYFQEYIAESGAQSSVIRDSAKSYGAKSIQKVADKAVANGGSEAAHRTAAREDIASIESSIESTQNDVVEKIKKNSGVKAKGIVERAGGSANVSLNNDGLNNNSGGGNPPTPPSGPQSPNNPPTPNNPTNPTPPSGPTNPNNPPTPPSGT